MISTTTEPQGGTSDYIPEMLHNAVLGKVYNSFVDSDTAIPFMTMPDAVQAIQDIMVAPMKSLNQTVYNVRAFAPTADEFRDKVIEAFPQDQIEYEVNEKRQNMVDSWPADTNDSAARMDWRWNPQHDLETGMQE